MKIGIDESCISVCASITPLTGWGRLALLIFGFLRRFPRVVVLGAAPDDEGACDVRVEPPDMQERSPERV